MTSLAGQGLVRHIENGDLPAVLNLIESGNLHLDERDENGQTFLMVACQNGHMNIVNALFEADTHDDQDVDAVDNDNWTALLNAAKEGHADIAVELLERGAFMEHRDIGGWTALTWACYKGRTEVAQALLQRGANANVKGEHHMSCLTWAAGRGHTEIVKMLLARGAKVNTADKYGTTPLIWAARKGHLEIVEALLDEGANVDNAGMNSWTALIVAAKGGYTEVVNALLTCNPNVNAVDKDGFTALTIAAKDGHTEIVHSLLQKGAYVNLPDRYGDTILIHAVKGGHPEVVEALVKKYADVNTQGVDNKTALYWAVEKNHTAIARTLLHFTMDTEMATKDGDTPLLKAVRNRNYDLVQLLMDKSARVSATDKKGDTALHIAVRGRSKRISELLLRNPKHSRLLYKPNNDGETAYQIDAVHQKSVLAQIFGARHLNAEESVHGYDLYSSTIADVLSEPTLKLPITVGLYAKWGSGKSFLLDKLQKEMKTFTQHSADSIFEFSWMQFLLCLLLSAVIGVVLGFTVRWEVGVAVGVGILAIQYLFLGLMWFGCTRRGWVCAYNMSVYLASKQRSLKLLVQVIFCNEPRRRNQETANVRFLFTDNARLASVVGEKSIAGMIGTLFDALESEYGLLVTRLYRVFKPGKASELGRFKSVCCIPYFVIVLFVFLCIGTASSLIAAFGVHTIEDKKYTVINGVLIAIAIIVGVAFLVNVYKWGQVIVNLIHSPRRRVQKIAVMLDTLKMEGFMQNLKKEVELMGSMVGCMDAFMHTHTRLVVIVDGLDSCEQDKLLQVLDTVHMLFGDQESPFITILAVDPHVIIKGIEHNLHGLFRDSSINGHDYLRNIVHLPFYMQSQATPKPQKIMADDSSHSHRDSVNHVPNNSTASKFKRTESTMSTVSQAIERGKRRPRTSSSSHSFGSTNLHRQPSTTDLSKSLVKNYYFSDVNPRNMRRLMNIIAITGRLLRAHNIDFGWYRVAAWINVTEQWPYRLSWIILYVEDNETVGDDVTLHDIYERVVPKMPASKEADPLLEIDRNARKLEIFLANHMPQLNVGDLRKFLPCTINVDPYLRKLIRELQNAADAATFDYGSYMPGYTPSQAGSIDMGLATGPAGWFRKAQSRHDVASPTPRATPTRPGSRPPMSPFGPHMLMPPHMAYWMGAMHQQQSQNQMAQQRSSSPAPRASPQVHLKGDMPGRLRDLTVQDICGLVGRLEKINKDKIAEYTAQLQHHNVNGFVLKSCELSELKNVMNMNFGDWELFRALVNGLREKDEAVEDNDRDDLLSPHVKFTQENMHAYDQDIEVPKAQYAKNTDRALRQKLEGNFPNSAVGTSRPRSSSLTITPSDTPDGPGREIERKYSNPLTSRVPRRPMQKLDSFIGEIIFENQMLHSAMEEQGLEEDDSDEDETLESDEIDNISNEAVEKVLVESQEAAGVRQDSNSQESGSRQDLEMAELGSCGKTDVKPKSILVKHKDKPLWQIGKEEIVNPTQVRNDECQTSFGVIDEESREEKPLLKTKGGSGKLASVSKLVRASLEKLSMRKHSSKEKLSVDETSPMLSQTHSTESGSEGQLSPNTGMTSLPSTSMSSLQIIEENATSPDKDDNPGTLSASAEVSLSKISLALSDGGRSAFRVVTPLSSRAPSAASSRAVSRESSMDTVGVVPAGEHFDGSTNESFLRQGSRMSQQSASSSEHQQSEDVCTGAEASSNSDNVQVMVDVHGNTQRGSEPIPGTLI